MVDLSLFPRDIENVRDIRTLSKSAGFTKIDEVKDDNKLRGHLTNILAKKSIFKKCRSHHVYCSAIKKCIPFNEGKEKYIDLKIKEGKEIVKTEKGEDAFVFAFLDEQGIQKFFLFPKKKKIMYQYAFSNIFEVQSPQKPDKMPEEIFEKVKTAFSMRNAFCVNLLGTVPVEETSKEVIKSLVIDVTFNSKVNKKFGIPSDVNILYSREINNYFIISDEKSNKDAIKSFIILGGKIGDRKCHREHPCEDMKEEYCKMKTPQEGSCVQDQFKDDEDLDEVVLDGSIFRGTPDVMREFRKLIPPATGGGISALVSCRSSSSSSTCSGFS